MRPISAQAQIFCLGPAARILGFLLNRAGTFCDVVFRHAVCRPRGRTGRGGGSPDSSVRPGTFTGDFKRNRGGLGAGGAVGSGHGEVAQRLPPVGVRSSHWSPVAETAGTAPSLGRSVGAGSATAESMLITTGVVSGFSASGVGPEPGHSRPDLPPPPRAPRCSLAPGVASPVPDRLGLTETAGLGRRRHRAGEGLGGREAEMKYGQQMKQLMERTSGRVDRSGWCAPAAAPPPPRRRPARPPARPPAARGTSIPRGARPKARPPAAWDGGATTNGSAP